MKCLSKFKNPRKKILFLGYDESSTRIIKSLIDKKCGVDHTDQKLNLIKGYDFVISFGYRHILNINTIQECECPILNLHIAYLPYNRGAHPNFWSFYDKTPSGVTIHLIDEGVDTGPIIYQKHVEFEKKDDTFTKTYAVLKFEIEKLFLDNLESILSNQWFAMKQKGTGTKHFIKDLPSNFSGWESNIKEEISKLKNEGLQYE